MTWLAKHCLTNVWFGMLMIKSSRELSDSPVGPLEPGDHLIQLIYSNEGEEEVRAEVHVSVPKR